MPNDADADRIVAELESDSPETRRAAVAATVQLGERAVRAMPILQRMVSADPVTELRHHARKALYLLRLDAHLRAQGPGAKPAAPAGPKSANITEALSKESLPVVAKKLNHADPNVRASALRATAIKQDRQLLSVLLDRVGPILEPDPELRAILVRVIAILGGKEQLKAVASFLEDPVADVRAATIDVLAQYRDAMAFPFIVRALQDRESKPQQHAATVLGKVGPVNILKICTLMAKSDRAWSRDAAVFCLALTRIPDGLPILEEALKDPEAAVRQKARTGLARLAERGVPRAAEILAKAGQPDPASAPIATDTQELRIQPAMSAETQHDIASPEPIQRRAATKQLIALDGVLDDGHLPGLIERLKLETDETAILNLITALGRIKSEEVIPLLAQNYLTHADPMVRAAAVDALAMIGTPAARRPLNHVIRDASPVVIGRTLIALKNEASVDLVGELSRMADHAEVAFRTTAVYVITELADPKLAGVVEKLKTDSDALVASLAADAANILAPDLVPQARTTSSLVQPTTRPGLKATTPQAASRTAPLTRPGLTPDVTSGRGQTPAGSSASGGGPKVAGILLAAGGLAWLIVAAWHLSGDKITAVQIGLGAVSLVAGLGGLLAGYACLHAERWGFKSGLTVSAIHALLALAHIAAGLPVLVVLAPVGVAAAALLYRGRASF